MKTIIKTDKAPAPIGPYNQAVKAGSFIYTSGQIAINPENGKLEQSSIEAETRLTLQNLSAVISAAGARLEQVVKCSIFIADMNDFKRINAVYSEFFEDKNAPARETVEVARLPKDARVEISAVVYLD
jgi:2-iminobutanoate/2-iminopropanoate deaminase